MVRLAVAALIALGLGLAAAPAPAAADPPKWIFVERGNSIYVTTSVTSVFDVAAYNHLEDGLPSTVVIRMWVYPEGSKRPVAFQLLQRTVVYDLWDEVYQVALSWPTGGRVYTVKYRAEALTLMTALDQVKIADAGALGYGTHYVVALVAELNPVSPETLAEVRRWLSDGAGGGLDRGGSFFGSFVSVFVNLKIPEADRVVRQQSQPFYRPRPKAKP